MHLQQYGFTEQMALQWRAQAEERGAIPARVSAVHKERYELICQHGTIFGRLKTSDYYIRDDADFPTVGDFVLLVHNAMGDSQIVATLPRSAFFSRRDPDRGRGEQAVAANFDYVFIMQSLNEDFNTKRIERYATLAWQSGAQPVIILTKADLVADYANQVLAAQAAAIGANVHAISVVGEGGVQALQAYLSPGKTIVFLGSSGVGKSSLVNALTQQEVMAVGDIREDDARGRHTTTHRQLLMLPCGAMVIDTPGMREMGMWDVSTGLGEAFSDVQQHVDGCRFSDCTHKTEPGCAVQAALRSGELSPQRWNSYLKLQKEAEYDARKQDYRKIKTAANKAIAKFSKEGKKSGRIRR